MFAMSDGRPAPAHPDAVVQGDTYRFTVLSPCLIRMEWDAQGRFVDERSQLVVSRDFPVPDFTVTHLPEGGLEIVTDQVRLRHDGREFATGGLSVALTRDARDPHYSVWHYGMTYPQGLPYRGNLLGTARTLDEVDGACELEPGILSTFGFAVVDDSESVLLSQDGWIAPRPGAATAEGGQGQRKDLYLFAHGRDQRAALREYHQLTGPQPLVPRYTLGNWWSRYWRYTEESYLELMDTFRERDIPLSVSVIDMDWHIVDVDPEIGTGWTGYTWDPELFPDPKRFLDALHERGLAVTLNVHPADGVRRHEAAYPEMARELGIDPASGLPISFDIADRAFVDAYLRHLHHPLEEQGVDFWWLDWQSGGVSAVPGLDPLWMLNHVHFHDSGRERADGARRRPLTFSRYAGLGSHRYPVGFSGDTIISWDSLDFQPYFTNTAANVGFGWWSHDVGGHMFGGRDVELATRWFQYGVFSPINRLHSSNSPFTTKEPWAFGPRSSAIMSRFLRLRHRLVPALYTAAWAAHTDNVSVVRPMYHDYPVMDALSAPNEAMFTEHLLVAPITQPEEERSGVGRVKAWMPEGSWFDLFTGDRYRGGRHATFHRPLETYPVLARAGAVLPLAADPFASVAEVPDALELRLFPGEATSHLVEDHGEAEPAPEDRNVTRFVQSLQVREDGRADVVLRIEPTTGPDPLAVREVTLDVVGAATVESVSIVPTDGEEQTLDAAQVGVHEDELLSPALRITLGRVDLARGLEVRLTGLEAVAETLVQDAFDLLDAAEIPFIDKQIAWRAISELSGLELATELGSQSLPASLRGALVERASIIPPW